MELIYSIYILCDPRDRVVRYVGMSKHIQQQYRDHCRGGSSLPITAWVQALRELGLTPDLRIFEEEIVGEATAFRRKWHWAEVCVSKGAVLFNSISPSVLQDWSKYVPTDEENEVYHRRTSTTASLPMRLHRRLVST